MWAFNKFHKYKKVIEHLMQIKQNRGIENKWMRHLQQGREPICSRGCVYRDDWYREWRWDGWLEIWVLIKSVSMAQLCQLAPNIPTPPPCSAFAPREWVGEWRIIRPGFMEGQKSDEGSPGFGAAFPLRAFENTAQLRDWAVLFGLPCGARR